MRQIWPYFLGKEIIVNLEVWRFIIILLNGRKKTDNSIKANVCFKITFSSRSDLSLVKELDKHPRKYQ